MRIMPTNAFKAFPNFVNIPQTNEDLKDFIYYSFNSKYAREGFVTYDSSVSQAVPFSLKDDTNYDIHSESEISDFGLVKKYMRVVDSDIINNDSPKDNIKHLQGAVRLIRRALLPEDKGYIEKIQLAVQLEIHTDELNSINQKYIEVL